ncbi:hypothetical protein Ahy_A01g000527 [Arachis hypogaea]|uniref:Uncharacterized protein n=1 Tax=Arachis hypogaea TaxID=3818 RepID=A0A445EKE8_ARAHY|nr:hypothetical protein Ahy_A01g000527 [Arachis hypogaea]
MDDRVLLKVYYFGQILLQTSEGVKFVCEDLLDVVIPFTISFEELKDVANALANEVPFEKSSFMRVLDLEAMHALEFSDYISADGEFAVEMKFSSREAVIKAIKERYNDSHTCTRATISQYHLKLDSNTIAKGIKPLVEADPSLKLNKYLEVRKHLRKRCPYGYLRTVREYEVRYQRLRERGEAYTNWLNRILREQYALAFDGGY